MGFRGCKQGSIPSRAGVPQGRGRLEEDDLPSFGHGSEKFGGVQDRCVGLESPKEAPVGDMVPSSRGGDRNQRRKCPGECGREKENSRAPVCLWRELVSGVGP